MRRPRGSNALLGVGTVLALALLALPVARGGAVPGREGTTTYVSLWATPAVAVEGSNITLQVNISNPSPVSLTIRLLLFVVADPHQTPIPFGSLQNISLPADTNLTIPYWWIAVTGVHTLAVYATLEFAGSLVPLPPAECQVSITSRTTNDVLEAVGYVLLTLVWVVVLVVAPSVVATVRGRHPPVGARGPKAPESPPSPPGPEKEPAPTPKNP